MVCVCVCDAAAGGMQSAVAAVSPGSFPMLLQRPGSIPAEMLAGIDQQRRVGVPQHVSSLGGRVCATSLAAC